MVIKAIFIGDIGGNMGQYSLDMDKYADLARQVAADGCVLLKNDKEALPLRKNDKVAVFGRIAHTYYKSGLGSGGLVNTRYVVGILDALKQEKDIELNEKVLEIYEDWITDHPFDSGLGWGRVPWCQEEMPVTDGLLEAAQDSDVAIVIVGRTAGEDQDNHNDQGSFLLTDAERTMIEKVSARFERTVVLLNVGNIIDMKWVNEINPAAVMYVWQGGQEGGNGVADVLTGRVTPSGKLTDTIAVDISDYPSAPYFGDEKKNFYAEDIYVGYRYFETFAKKNVLYPFGFGLSYTEFTVESVLEGYNENNVQISATVRNTGMFKGREVVQVYVNPPQGELGKPLRSLIGFAKTKELAPGESQILELTIPKYTYASYDDSGATGNKSCYVLEEGLYEFYVGTDVRSAQKIGEFNEDFRIIERLQEAYAPTEDYKRIKPMPKDGSIDEYGVYFEPVPTRTVDWRDRRIDFPKEIPYTGDQGIRLADVFYERAPMDDFVAQLSDEDLICLFRGEGMCSPKVTPGTAAAFGGVTESLRRFGIPTACCSDGPSGIRMDVGTKAFSLPNGTMLGATFDLELVEELYRMTGLELRRNRIDALLGPGINIHRHPLNGRNFEYISEDPLLTGKMGAAQIRGLDASMCTGTIKHFCANNQETKRRFADGIVSERALREIYLKCFEICVKEANARSVMTSYGPINGLWTAGSYDLNTTILRNEWGFDGIVMSDWWAEANYEGESSNPFVHAPMVMAQNDIFMVCEDATNMELDDVLSRLNAGEIFRCELQRNAKNILNFILKSPAMLYELNLISQEELDEIKASREDEDDVSDIVYYQDENDGDITIDLSDYEMGNGKSILFGIETDKKGYFDATIVAQSDLDDLAQLPITVFLNGELKYTASFRGSNGKEVAETGDLGAILVRRQYIKLYIGADGINLKEIRIKFRGEYEFPF